MVTLVEGTSSFLIKKGGFSLGVNGIRSPLKRSSLLKGLLSVTETRVKNLGGILDKIHPLGIYLFSIDLVVLFTTVIMIRFPF